MNGSASKLTETTYDSYGNTTEVKQYDFGAAMPPTGNPLSDTTITHAGVNGVTCGTAAPYQFDRPCSITTRKPSTSGTMVQVSQIKYTYTNGHATSTSTWLSGSSTLNASASYNPNGTVKSSTNFDGNPTTYLYDGTDGCNGLLPTSITAGGLSESIQWDCNGGVPTKTTDPNQQSTIYTYNDPFWRMTLMTDPLGVVTNFNYLTPNTFETVMNFNGSTSTSDTLITSDGLDRQIFKQTRQGPGLSTFDSIQTTYGWNSTGPFTTTTLPYSGTVAQAAPVGTGFITTKDDVSNRPISVSDFGGGVTSLTYAQNDVLSILSPAPAGENNKQVQSQFDGLGRPTSVCAISGAVTGKVTCGQNTNTSATGVLTTTSYSTSTGGAQTVSSTRGIQTRSQTVDPLGRVTSSTSPESGTKTYIYDVATATCGSGIAVGALVETVDNAGVHTCLGIDVLYRVNHLALVSNGVWSNDRWFVYGDTPYTPPSGVTIQNGKGRVVEAYTGAKDVDEWFSYDKAGRLTDVWELTPHSGGYYHTTATYFANGAVQSVSGVPGVNGATYGIDGEGRPSTGSFGTTSIVNANGVVYNAASQQLTVPNMESDTDVYQYDGMGRMKKYIISVNGVSATSTLGWNANSTLGSLSVVDNITPSENQTCNFGTSSVAGYDDLGRLLNDNCSPVWSQSFTYDQYDNITKSGSVSWNPGYNAANNQYSSIGATYDPSGNLTWDTFNTYTWDGYQKVASINPAHSTATCGTSGWCLTYDALGRMVELNASGTYSEILYSPIGKTAIMSGQTASKIWYPMPGGGTVLASSTNWPHYQHKDWLGSGRLQTEFSGTLGNSARTVDYDRSFAPYGEMYGSTGNDAYDLDFTGDVKTMWSSGLLDTPNREFHPNQGRWISPDPAGAGWNPYAYSTNPNSETDPSGLFAGGIEGGGGPCDASDCGGTPCALDDCWGAPNPCDYGFCTFDGFGDLGISNVPSGGPPTSNNIFTGQDSPYWSSLASQIAGLLGSILPCRTDVGAPCASEDYTSGPYLNPNAGAPYLFITQVWWPFLPSTPWGCHFLRSGATCFVYYGNWGGPGYSGGQFKPLESLTPQEISYLAPPIDAQDACYEEHDWCYSGVRTGGLPGFGSCDFQLQQCLHQGNSSGGGEFA